MGGTQPGPRRASGEHFGARGRVEGARCLLQAAGLSACLLVLGFPTPGSGQQTTPTGPESLKKLSLEELAKIEVVYAASKREQKLTEAPSSVSIVTREDIRQYGYRTMFDLLKSVRGLYLTSDDAYSYTGLRGINQPGDYGGRILLTVDGHRINEPFYDSTFVGTEFPLDVDLIERVEVIRGPGSSLFGNNAFFAVINVVTRRAADMAGGEVSGTAASYNTHGGRFTYGQRLANGVGMIFSGSALAGEGRKRIHYPEFSTINGGVAENLDGIDNGTTFASMSRGAFALQGAFMKRHKDVANAPFGSLFDDPRTEEIDERAYLKLNFTRELNTDASFRVGLSYYHYRFEGIYPFNYSAPDPGPHTINRDQARSESVGGELQFNQTLGKKHRLMVGSDLRTDLRLDLANADDDPPFTYMDSRHTATMVGAFAQDEYAVRPNLLINAGVRYDHFNTFGGTVNPRAAVIYNPGAGRALKLIYGQAFRAPNAYEFYYGQAKYKTNPGLRPEHVYSTELVYEQVLSKSLRLTSSFFHSDVDGLIGLRTDPADGMMVFENLVRARSTGFEGELEGQWQNGYRGRISYTNARARDDSMNRVLSNSPRHVGKGNLTVPLWRDRLGAGLEVQAMSSRMTVKDRECGGFWLANLTITGRNVRTHLEMSASAYNLFDRSYADPMSVEFRQEVLPQARRNFRVKLTYTF